MIAMTMHGFRRSHRQGQGGLSPLGRPPFTLEVKFQPKENGPAPFDGSFPGSSFHGDFAPRRSRMDKFFRSSEKRNGADRLTTMEVAA